MWFVAHSNVWCVMAGVRLYQYEQSGTNWLWKQILLERDLIALWRNLTIRYSYCFIFFSFFYYFALSLFSLPSSTEPPFPVVMFCWFLSRYGAAFRDVSSFLMYNIPENRNQWHFSKKCGVFAINNWLPTKVAWKFWISACSWGSFSEADYGGEDFISLSVEILLW